jgi:ABC-type transport system involved in cytochrome c biogenesis permease subunit
MLFYDIKKHRFGLIYKQLPSLEVMASFTYRSATLGLLFLTVAMVGGFVLLVKVYGTYWSWDPKLMTTIITWLIYSLGLAASRVYGWSAKRMALTSLAGFTVILFSLMIVNLVLTRFHVFV